jgi:hypothetical protein
MGVWVADSLDRWYPRIVFAARSGCRPTELALAFLDDHVIDAGLSTPHQTLFVKLPEFVAISSEPLPVCVVVLVLKADSDSILGEAPQGFGEPIVKFLFPLVG